MENQSKYDPSRKTVGAIYRDSKLANTEDSIECGDMTNELLPGLVEDINTCIQEECTTGAWQGREFYIQVHEAKDLAMPNMIKRRMIKTLYRPWPEDDTIVFRINPERSEIRFCWCLPHHTEMDNMLMNSWLFDQEMVNDIINWKNLNMQEFGFVKVGIGEEWAMNPNWNFGKDRKMIKKSKVIAASSKVMV
jgi:hypothetical protein